MVLPISPLILELLLKERILSYEYPPMRRETGLDYLKRKYILYPLEQIFWRLPTIAIYFQIPWLFPDFPSPF